MNTTRRRFLQTSMGVAAGWTLHRTLAAQGAAQPPKIPIAVQLYVLRDEFARDVPGTLKAVKEAGFQGVEFWGYGGTPNVFQQYSAKQLRRILDDLGLKCCGMHISLAALDPARLHTTVENNQVLGNHFLNVASADEYMRSEEKILSLATLLNETAKKVRPHKMRVGYHAHPQDFIKIGGRFAWEILFSHADPEILMQMDVGNCLAGHGDPVAMLREFPGRTLSIHLKEYEDKTFDSPYYQEIFHLCETTCKTQWYIVEMESGPGTGMSRSRAALATLHRLGK
ncbi:MAG: TIM barrel protein [Thermoguttaceae bacterium]|jgi:sugar phosphate isomerase/epimerase